LFGVETEFGDRLQTWEGEDPEPDFDDLVQQILVRDVADELVPDRRQCVGDLLWIRLVPEPVGDQLPIFPVARGKETSPTTGGRTVSASGLRGAKAL